MRRNLCLSALLLLCLQALTTLPARGEDARAIIFMDPDVTEYERSFQDSRVEQEIAYYTALGLPVVVREAADKEALSALIVAALLDDDVTAISFFGHGYGPQAKGATSTLLFEDAKHWEDQMYRAQRKRLAALGETGVAANRKARALAKTAGLEIMRNHSCSSLLDTRIADLLVAPGGSYFGVSGLYATCPTPRALLWDVDWELTEYVVPMPGVPSRASVAERVTAPGGVCTEEGYPGPVLDCRYSGGGGACVPCPNGFNFHYDPSRYD